MVSEVGYKLVVHILRHRTSCSNISVISLSIIVKTSTHKPHLSVFYSEVTCQSQTASFLGVRPMLINLTILHFCNIIIVLSIKNHELPTKELYLQNLLDEIRIRFENEEDDTDGNLQDYNFNFKKGLEVEPKKIKKTDTNLIK